jgi:hypothetical protein
MGIRSILRWGTFVVLSVLLHWHPTEFRTPVTVDYDGTLFRVHVLNAVLETPRSGMVLKKLSLRTQPSLFWLGGTAIDLSGGNAAPIHYPLPEVFEFKNRKQHPFGDWYLDDSQDVETVWSREVTLPGPFHLETTLTGRSLQGVLLGLEGTQGLILSVRRGLINNDTHLMERDGRVLQTAALVASWPQSLLEFLDPYLIGLWVAMAFSLLLTYRPGTDDSVSNPSWTNPTSRGVWILIGLHTALVIVVAGWILEAMPHFQDDLCYLLRAKWLLAGHLTQAAPLLPDHFQIPFTYISGHKWATYYPIGWPLLLAIGEFFQAAWLVSPLCSALYLVLLWHLGRKLGGPELGWSVLLLSSTCLLGWILSASLMTHAASSLLLVCAVYGFWRGEDEKLWRWSLAGGSALGYLFTIRPLTSVAAGIVLGLFALPGLRQNWRNALAFALGVGGLASLALWDNARVTGSPWLFAYTAGYGYHWTWSTLAENLVISDSTLALVLPHAFGWDWAPRTGIGLAVIGLGLALLPFVSGRARRIEWILLALFFSLPVAYSGISITGAHGFGPRYYYDVFFCLFLLSGRGFSQIRRSLESLPRPFYSWLWILSGIVLLGLGGLRAVINLPRYRGYNVVDSSLVQAIDARPQRRALVLLDSPDYLQWIRASPRLQSSQSDDLIFAGSLEDNTALLHLYEGRTVYRWTGNRLELVRP